MALRPQADPTVALTLSRAWEGVWLRAALKQTMRVVLALLTLCNASNGASNEPACSSFTPPTDLYDPAIRDVHYGDNIAQYLVDLHDTRGTFDFCGVSAFARPWAYFMVLARLTHRAATPLSGDDVSACAF